MGDDSPKAKLYEAVPVFLVSDIASTMHWYSAKLGFDAHAVPASPPHDFCILKKDDVKIFLQQLDGSPIFMTSEKAAYGAPICRRTMFASSFRRSHSFMT